MTFYDEVCAHYATVYQVPGSLLPQRVADARRYLQLPSGSRILDIGVGQGPELAYLADYDVVGIDTSPSMLDVARLAHPRAQLVVADAFAPLPFEDGAFDGAVAFHGFLSHARTAKALRSLAVGLGRVVRPGGRVVFEEPTELHAVRTEDCVAEREGERGYRVTDARTGASWLGMSWDDHAIAGAFEGWDLASYPVRYGERLVVLTRGHG